MARETFWHVVAGSAAVAATAVAAFYLRHRQRKNDDDAEGLIFTGTGCSSGLPLVQCALHQAVRPPGCKSCDVALSRGRGDKNWRGNVGALLRFIDPTTAALRHVQIDCGKTFREVVTMQIYRAFHVKWLDALVLTHDHMDAVGGLDELRSLQMYDLKTFEVASSIRCVCDRRTLARLRHAFPYLFPKPKRNAAAPFKGVGAGVCECCEMDLEGVEMRPEASASGTTDVAEQEPEAKPAVKRFVAKIDWESFGATGADGQPLPRVTPINLCGLPAVALPLQHGADYVCFGYGFGPEDARIVYLSDYTAILAETDVILRRWSTDGAIELMVLDALRWDQTHPVHASAFESIDLVRRYRPRRTLLVGMGHTMEHEETNRELRRMLASEGLDVQLAYDGQFVPLRFF